MSEKINKTKLSSCKLVVGKPCESITECSRVQQLSEYHYCGTLLHSVIDRASPNKEASPVVSFVHLLGHIAELHQGSV